MHSEAVLNQSRYNTQPKLSFQKQADADGALPTACTNILASFSHRVFLLRKNAKQIKIWVAMVSTPNGVLQFTSGTNHLENTMSGDPTN